jgi:MEMO1 family protein
MIRKAAVAGGFYPLEKRGIESHIENYLSEAKSTQIPGNLRGLVVPHAGYVYSGPIAAYGYKLLSSHQKNIQKIILLGPSHHAGFYGAAEAGFDVWETPIGKVKAGKISDLLENPDPDLFPIYPEAHIPEHCLEVQLPFLQMAMKKEFTIFPLLICEIDPGKLALALRNAIDEKTLVIASSDLSHYHPYEKAMKIDAIANDAIPRLDIQKFEEYGDACGKLPILTLMHLAKLNGWTGKFLDYRNSGDTAGDKDRVVGYGCFAFYK